MRLVLGVTGGLTVAAAIGALNFFIARYTGFDFSTLAVLFVVPIGATLMGVPAAVVFNFLAWSSAARRGRFALHAAISLLLGAATLAFSHLITFSDIGLLGNGNSFSEAFTIYFGDMTMTLRHGGYDMNEWGLVLGAASYVGASLGGLFGIIGIGLSGETPSAANVDKARHVSMLAILLGMMDGELDDEELACSRYVTKLALETANERRFGASKQLSSEAAEEIVAEAQSKILPDASYAELADRCTKGIGAADKVFNNVVLYGLAAVIAKSTTDPPQREQLILLAYIAEKLGVANMKTNELLGFGHAMRLQILNGTMK